MVFLSLNYLSVIQNWESSSCVSAAWFQWNCVAQGLLLAEFGKNFVYEALSFVTILNSF